MMDNPIFKIPSAAMANGAYQIEVWPYAFGQYRIQLESSQDRTEIVRECCTYNADKAIEVLKALKVSTDPEAYLRTLETPHNCEGENARIRLDTTEADNPFRQFQRGKNGT